MRFPEKIDLHIHSNVSDGTDTPLEVLKKVQEKNIGIFALTDHDAIKGCEIILNEIHQKNLTLPLFLTGAEFSCRDALGKYHILGYGYDPQGASIQALVGNGHDLRIFKLTERIRFLREKFGFIFDPKDIEELFALDNPGKPHLGNLMVKYGYAPNKKVAIEEYINQWKSPNKYLRPEEAIAGILQSGGVPVLAHPSYGDGDQLIMGKELEDRIKRLMVFGLQGVEAYYSGFTPRLEKELLGLAEKYDLYVTAGSDYHGSNKLVILGENNLASVQEAVLGLHRFLERVLDVPNG